MARNFILQRNRVELNIDNGALVYMFMNWDFFYLHVSQLLQIGQYSSK